MWPRESTVSKCVGVADGGIWIVERSTLFNVEITTTKYVPESELGWTKSARWYVYLGSLTEARSRSYFEVVAAVSWIVQRLVGPHTSLRDSPAKLSAYSCLLLRVGDSGNH